MGGLDKRVLGTTAIALRDPIIPVPLVGYSAACYFSKMPISHLSSEGNGDTGRER